MEKKINILLLTNRDSDNVGDQVIEACDISLVKTIMKNLNIAEGKYKISSRAAAIVTKKYLSSRREEDLAGARKAISECDLVLLGGAPMFNYRYQNFYERTAVTLELAKEYGVPVIFSAIGIEGYDENNEKCQRLKNTLNFDNVLQVTTRDGFEFLKKYKENEKLQIAKVSDPAVFAGKVFEKNKQSNFEKNIKSLLKKLLLKKQFIQSETKSVVEKKLLSNKKKIGIFVLRANGFKDNGVNFSRNDAAILWKEIASELEKRNYDYEFLTSGHFGDEAYLDYLIREHGIEENKCIFNINKPETLIKKMSEYQGVISCRLHPSIISYSMNIPAVGIVWNNKVEFFYESIGYAERVIKTEGISAKNIVDKLEYAIEEGYEKDKKYLNSVYETLFEGIKNVFCPNSEAVSYTYDKVLENMIKFAGTSKKEENLKLKRKFRRTYEKYNQLMQKKNL